MLKNHININSIWTDINEIAELLKQTFKVVAPQLSVLYTRTEGLKEVKVSNGNDYYCISQITGTRMDVDKERWALAILKLDGDGMLTYKYMHPITQEVVVNAEQLDISTLPTL